MLNPRMTAQVGMQTPATGSARSESGYKRLFEVAPESRLLSCAKPTCGNHHAPFPPAPAPAPKGVADGQGFLSPIAGAAIRLARAPMTDAD